MKRLLTTILLVLFYFSVHAQVKKPDSIVVNYLSPHVYTIGKIRVTGDPYLDKNVIVAIGGLSANQKITIPGDEIPKAINNLWKHQLFSNVQILLDSVVNDKVYL